MTSEGTSRQATARVAGPHLGVVAIVFTILFNLGLYFVVSFSANKPHFPGPWESGETIAAYFQGNSSSVLMCSFFHFGAAISLGVFTAAAVNQLQFLGVRAAGVYIALLGGLLTAFDIAASANTLWVMAVPGMAQDASVVRMLYYQQQAFGGVGFSVPMGLLMAGISVTSAFRSLLPRWIIWPGILLAIVGELSWLNMIFPQALFLVPLTRFPGFAWLIAAGFALPRSNASRA